MGDHRASIKGEFSMYGETRKIDMWINWSPDSDYQGVDQRVLDFFRDAAWQMRARYESQFLEAMLKEQAAELEKKERSEYERLRAKFDKGTS